MPNSQRLAPEWDELALEVGKFIRYWGFKVIHGRIWTHLYLSDRPLDAGTLMERFGLSKALMSLSLNDLLKHNVIIEGPKSKKGTQTYRANPEVLDVILSVLRHREKGMLTEIKSAYELLNSVSEQNRAQMKINPKRLENLGKMISQAQQTLDTILDLAELNLKDWTFLNEDLGENEQPQELQ